MSHSNKEKCALCLVELPPEILTRIATLVDHLDRANLRLVCSLWKDVVDSPCVWSACKVDLKFPDSHTIKPFMYATLKKRNLTCVSLHKSGLLRVTTAESLVELCPNLTALECHCYMLQCFVQYLILKGRIGRIRQLSVHVDAADCQLYDYSCLLSLLDFTALRKLGIADFKDNKRMSRIVRRVASKLPGLESLSLQPKCPGPCLHVPVALFPELTRLSVPGCGSRKDWFLKTYNQEDDKKHEKIVRHKLKSLTLEINEDFDLWVKSVPFLNHLNLANVMEDTIITMSSNLPRLTDLTVKSIDETERLPLHLLPRTLTRFKFINGVWGHNYRHIPRKMPSSLHQQLLDLSLYGIVLSSSDVKFLAKHYTALTRLRFTLQLDHASDVNAILCLAGLRNLRTLILGYNGPDQAAMDDIGQRLTRVSRQQIQVSVRNDLGLVIT